MPGLPEADDRLPPLRSLGEWRRGARRFLAAAGIESPVAEADLIARHVLGLTRVELTLAADRVLSRAEKRRLSRILHRRRRRVPLQYLLGEVDFWGLSLRVTPRVLIPRPETEGLVERVLSFLGPDPEATVVDVGTGSGAIALALAAARPRLTLWASDSSAAAVRVARENARRLGLSGRIRFAVGDLAAPFEGEEPERPLRVLVSNPPYVSTRNRRRLEPEVAEHEPALALFGGEGGLDVIRRLVPAAARRLPAGALLALEIGDDQGERVRRIIQATRGWRSIRIEKDLAGRDRYALAVRTG
jgi:release factor glutamine methyltransferase